MPNETSSLLDTIASEAMKVILSNTDLTKAVRDMSRELNITPERIIAEMSYELAVQMRLMSEHTHAQSGHLA